MNDGAGAELYVQYMTEQVIIEETYQEAVRLLEETGGRACQE